MFTIFADFNNTLSWGERNTAVTQFLETFEERQKNFAILFLFATWSWTFQDYKLKT